MGGIISLYKNRNNKQICDEFITKYISIFTNFNININFLVGANLKTKVFRYRNVEIPKYYIIFHVDEGFDENKKLKINSKVILNRSEYNRIIPLTRYQGISNFYKPLENSEYQVAVIPIISVSTLDEALYRVVKIIEKEMAIV
jgi:hypothetical protein